MKQIRESHRCEVISMADITYELNIIMNKRYGVDIRNEIHDAIDKINKQLDAQDAGEESEDGAGHLTGT